MPVSIYQIKEIKKDIKELSEKVDFILRQIQQDYTGPPQDTREAGDNTPTLKAKGGTRKAKN